MRLDAGIRIAYRWEGREMRMDVDLLDRSGTGRTAQRPRRAPGAAQSNLRRQLLQRGDRCIYFFKQDHYVRYKVATVASPDGSTEVTEFVDVGPAPISRFWTHLHSFFHENIDAAVNWAEGKAYFFKQDHYVRYNIPTDMVDVGPVPISRFWTGLHPFFHSDIDAVVNWGDGKAYFFKRDHYVRYDIATNLVDVGPAPIARFWTHLPAFFHSDLDAVVNWGDGKAYFFKQDHYVRVDIASDLVDVGPVPIARFWTRLPPFFHRDLGAVVNWTAPMDLAALFRSLDLTVNEVGDWRARARPEAFGFTPVGIMMHHTGARDSLGVIVNGRRDPQGRFLAGPLANFHVPKSGIINLVSGGITNHSGPGARQVLIEVTNDTPVPGTARARGLGATQRGAGFFYGLENENLGDNRDPWPAAQVDTMVLAATALCRAHCWSPERVIAHAEWRADKSDPLGIDMADFRDRVRSTLG